MDIRLIIGTTAVVASVALAGLRLWAQERSEPIRSVIGSVSMSLPTEAPAQLLSVQVNGNEVGTLGVPTGVFLSSGVIFGADLPANGDLLVHLTVTGLEAPIKLVFHGARMVQKRN
jgi:hypothetical protein